MLIEFPYIRTLEGELILGLCQLPPDSNGRRILKEDLDTRDLRKLWTQLLNHLICVKLPFGAGFQGNEDTTHISRGGWTSRPNR